MYLLENLKHESHISIRECWSMQNKLSLKYSEINGITSYCLCYSVDHGSANFFKDQIANILGFVNNRVTTTPLSL